MDANSVVAVREVSRYLFEPEIFSAVITGIFILGAAFIGYFFGLRTYFRKREHELILKRYLDEGIDRLSALIDNASQVFFSNYMTADKVLSELESFQESDLSLVKFHTTQILPEFTPYYKLTDLVGDNAFVLYIQRLLVFIDSQTTYLDSYFRPLVSKAASILRDNKEKGLETVKKLSGELTEVHKRYLKEDFKKFNEFTFLMDELQTFASILEKEERLTWAYVREFRNRNDVKQSVEMVKKKLAEQIQFEQNQ